MVPPLVLREGKEHILVNWKTECYQKKKISSEEAGVQLSVKEFPTGNQRNTFVKVTSGNGWFQTFLHCYPLASESVTSSSAAMGETVNTKW
jgi:hypothetical protein